MVFKRRRKDAVPEPPEEIQQLVKRVARWIVASGGTSAFSGQQGGIVPTPFDNCRLEVCIAGDERQTFHVLYPTATVATIVFSVEVGGESHYLETKWPTA